MNMSTPTCFRCGVETRLVLLSIQGRRDYLRQVANFKTYLTQMDEGDDGVETCANCVQDVKTVWELTKQIQALQEEIAEIVEKVVTKGGQVDEHISSGEIKKEKDDHVAELDGSQLDLDVQVKQELDFGEDEDVLHNQPETLEALELGKVKDEEVESVPDDTLIQLGSTSTDNAGSREPRRKRKLERDPLAVSDSEESSEESEYFSELEKSSESQKCSESEEGSELDEATESEEFSESHSDLQNTSYNCESCDITFDKKSSLAKHIKEGHAQAFSCSLCCKRLSTQRQWAVHEATVCKVPGKDWGPERLKTEFNITLATCPVARCRKVFDSQRLTDLKRHVAVHSQSPLGLGTKRTRSRHRPDTPDSEEGSKSELNQNTDRVNVLKRKRKPRSPNKKKRTLRNKYICPYCKNELGGRQSLSDHIRFVHFGEKPHKCEECSEAFTTSYKLASHVKRRHSQESFSCSGCDKEFKTRRSWAFHEAAICRVEGWSEERLKNECNLVLVSCKVKGCGKLMDQSMPDRIKRHLSTHDGSAGT